MAQGRPLADLAERRRALVERSARLRQELAEELASLQARAGWLERGYRLVRAGRVLLPLAAGVAGVFAMRRQAAGPGKLRRLLSLWQLGRRVRTFWR